MPVWVWQIFIGVKFSFFRTKSDLFISRLPRTLAVILVGATLAVAGMVLQIVLKNRFIEPSMIGTSQSAAIGILLASLLFPTSALLLKMSIATLSALMGMGLFMLLIRQLPPHQQLMLPLIDRFWQCY